MQVAKTGGFALQVAKQAVLRLQINNILELGLTRSIARKSQSFGGFERIRPAEVQANTKGHFQRKLTGMQGRIYVGYRLSKLKPRASVKMRDVITNTPFLFFVIDCQDQAWAI